MDQLERYLGAARAAAAETGVPLAWILGVIGRESSFRAVPMPVYEPHSAQRESAWGPMQILGSTARDRGLLGPLEQLLVPEVGILYGARQLAWLQERYGNRESDVLSAYNWGHPEPVRGADYVNGVRQWIDRISVHVEDISTGVGGVALVAVGLGFIWWAMRSPRGRQ